MTSSTTAVFRPIREVSEEGFNDEDKDRQEKIERLSVLVHAALGASCHRNSPVSQAIDNGEFDREYSVFQEDPLSRDEQEFFPIFSQSRRRRPRSKSFTSEKDLKLQIPKNKIHAEPPAIRARRLNPRKPEQSPPVKILGRYRPIAATDGDSYVRDGRSAWRKIPATIERKQL